MPRHFPRLMLLAVIVVLLIPIDASSFLGNISLPGVGQLPCLVACGGSRGVVNTRFLGDAVSQWVTGPSVDHFEEAGNRVVDRANEKLNATLDAKMKDFAVLLAAQREAAIAGIAAQREAFQVALRQTSDDAIQKLDATLQENLKEGDIVLERRLGNLNTISERFVITLSSGLRQAFIFLCILVFTCAAIFFWRVGKRRRIVDAALITVAALFVVMVATLGFERHRLGKLENELTTEYHNSLSELNFRYALYWASQLQTLHPASVQYRAYAAKSAVLREIFSRPTRPKTSEGLREVLSRAREVQSLYKEAGLGLDADIQIASSLVLWQAARDRFEEYAAANLSAQGVKLARMPQAGFLKSIGRSQQEADPCVLMPLALHYLKTYLTYPVSDEELTAIGLEAEKQNLQASDTTFRYLSVAELRAIAMGDAEVAPTSPLYPYLTYGSVTRHLYRQVVPAYLAMIQAHLGAEVAVADQQVKLLKDRDEAASNIISAWTEYVAAIGSDSLRETQLPLKSLSALTATYLRAKAYKGSNPASGIPPAAAEEGGIHLQLMQLVRPSLSDLAYAALSASAGIDSSDQQTQLINLESKMRDFMVKVKDYNNVKDGSPAVLAEAGKAVEIVANELSAQGATLGIFACDSKSPSCLDSGTDGVRDFISVVFDLVPAGARHESPVVWRSAVTAAVANRTLPIL